MSPLLLEVLSFALNFIILVVLIMKFAVPKISEAMSNKQDMIVRSIDEAEKNLEDISHQMEQYRKSIANVETEIAAIHDEARERGVTAAAKIEADTQREVELLRKRVAQQIEQEQQQLKNTIRREVVEQVMTLAESMAEKQMNKQNQAALVEGFAYSLKDFKEYTS